jgi:hypothetical protein
MQKSGPTTTYFLFPPNTASFLGLLAADLQQRFCGSSLVNHWFLS